MSARVFNPMFVSDLRNLRTATANEVRKPPTPQALSKVRRNLFGPVDHISSRKFVAEELSKLQSQASDKWGFDFVSESPLPGANRFAWERVNAGAAIPEAYAFRITPQNTEQPTAPQAQITPVQIDTMPTIDVQETAQPKNTERVQKGEVTPPSQIQKLDDGKSSISKGSGSSRQPKITHYMKHCKRPITAKKLDSTITKKRRLTTSTSS